MQINKSNVDRYANRIILAAITISIIFIICGHFYNANYKRFDSNSFKSFNLDWWSVSHFMLYVLFGFVKPGHPFKFFAMGCAWEVFEDLIANDSNTKLWDCVDKKETIPAKILCRGMNYPYWYAKVDDVFVNLLGYLTGQGLRSIMLK